MKAIRISSRHLGRAGLFGVAIATALVFFAAALVLRLLVAPLSIGPFAGPLRTSLGRALPGLVVRFDDAALEWSGSEDRLNLVILGARVFDANQRIIAQAPEAEIGLALIPFLHGHTVINRIALVGVQLTLVHSKSGRLELGVRGERANSDVLDRIRDALAKSGRESATLKSFAVRNARLAFYEEETGAFVVAPKAELQVSTIGRHRDLTANVDADIEISGKPARIQAAILLPRTGTSVTGDISVSGLSLKSLAANTKFFSFLAPFDVTSDVSGEFALDHGTHLREADFGIGAAGTVNGLGAPVHIRSFRITGRYDGTTGRLLIDDASLAGVQAQAHMRGRGDLTFDTAGSLSKANLELNLDRIAVNMPNVVDRQMTITHAVLRGSYTPADSVIIVDQALVFGGPLSAKFAGKIALTGSDSPQIQMDGTVAALPARALLNYWPLQVAFGARRWIDANVSGGMIGPVVVHAQIPAGALDLPALPDNAVSVSFPVTDATINYIRGMTPLTGVTGTAFLTGDTFRADVAAASAGSLSVSSGHAIIPDLHVHGTKGFISAHVDGVLPDVIALLDEKPLQYPSRFHIRRENLRGDASVDLNVRVPMLHDLKVDNVVINANAAVSGLGMSLGDHLEVSNGDLNFAVDNKGLHAVGTVSLDGANLGLDWREIFKPQGPFSTHVALNGVLSDAQLAALGYRKEYVTGPVGLSGDLDGNRGKVQRAQLRLDLTSSTVTLPPLGYRKPAGTQALAQMVLRLDNAGNIRNADVTLSGAALAARAALRMDPTGELQSATVPYFRSGTNYDFALSYSYDPVQGTSVSLTGHSFDGEGLVTRNQALAQPASPEEKTERPPEPFHITAKFDHVVLREGVVLSPFALDVSGTDHLPRTMTLSASLSKTAQLTGGIAGSDTERHLSLTANDAGLLLKGLFGETSIKGGTLGVEAALAATPAPANAESPQADYTGKLSMRDFTVTNQPFLMRLVSAGSFVGLADLMAGKGITIDTLDVPFVIRGDVMTIREARATGPSLGLTAEGYLDLRTNQLGLQGAFAPLYGINSIWGAIPILGNVLVSKKGEGLLGVTYSASGSADDPKVVVNPLSIITPGILRRVFQGRAPSAPSAEANSVPPVPKQKPQ